MALPLPEPLFEWEIMSYFSEKICTAVAQAGVDGNDSGLSRDVIRCMPLLGSVIQELFHERKRETFTLSRIRQSSFPRM